MSTLLHGDEKWTVYRIRVKKSHAVMMRHFRLIMKIKWEEKATNIKGFRRAGLPSMEDLLIKKNLHLTNHLSRMPTDCLLRQVLYSQPSRGRRQRGCQRLCYKHTFNGNLNKFIVSLHYYSQFRWLVSNSIGLCLCLCLFSYI